MANLFDAMRVLPEAHARLLAEAAPWTAGLPVVVGFAIFGLGRFGFFVFGEPARLLPLVAVGVFAWLAAGTVGWLAATIVIDRQTDARRVVRAYGHAHAAVVAAAFVAYMATIVFNVTGPGLAAVVVAGAAWFPAALSAGLAAAAESPVSRALLPALASYAVWIAIAAPVIFRQAGHLL